MDADTLTALSSLTEKVTSFGILLYFVMYFKQQSEESTRARIEHLERDIEKEREKHPD